MLAKPSLLATVLALSSLLSASACTDSFLRITLHDRWYGFGYSSDFYRGDGYHASTAFKIWKMDFMDCSKNGDYCYKIGHKSSDRHGASLLVKSQWREYMEPHNNHQNGGMYEYWDCI